MRTAIQLSLLVAGVILTSARTQAGDDEMVTNPAFKSWSKFPVGTTVTQRERIHYQIDNPEAQRFVDRAAVKDTKYKLLEVTDKKVVVECVHVEHGRGSETEEAPTKITFFARVKKGHVKTPKEQMLSIKESDEEVDVHGKKMKCKVVESSMKQGDITSWQKIWTSDEMPGGIVKEEKKFKRGDKVETETRVTVESFHVAKK